MGARHAETRTRTLGALASLESASAEQRRTDAEAQLKASERLLGTDAQRKGTLFEGTGLSESEAAFAGRYVLDEGRAKTFLGGKGIKKFQDSVTQANSLLEQAQQLARQGDVQGAEALRTQAQGQLASSSKANPQYAAGYRDLIRLSTDPDIAARASLSSPGARVVGDLVGTARELMDPGSEESQRVMGALQGAPLQALEEGRTAAEQAVGFAQEEAQRTIDAQGRSVQRRFRDLGASSGAASRPFQSAAIESRGQEQLYGARAQAAAQAGQSRATIESQVAFEKARVLEESGKWFETFRTQFASNAATLSQAYLQNQGGVREAFQASMDQMAQLGTQVALQAQQAELALAQMAHEQQMQVEKFRLERKAFFEQLGAGFVAGGIEALTGLGTAFTPQGAQPVQGKAAGGGGSLLGSLLGGGG